MRCISLWEPWASLMVLGHKTIETRSWPIRGHGPLLIHAAKRWTKEEQEYARVFGRYLGIDLDCSKRGHILGLVEAVDCRRTEQLVGLTEQEYEFGNYECGRFGWLTSHPRVFSQPISYRGLQGLFDVPLELLRGQP